MARATASGDLVMTGLTKRFGDFTAVDHLDLTIPRGSFFALLGPSGCGKTTTLRMVAGLEEPTAGSIRIGADDITYAKPYRRPVNTVFQSYALFPHLDVFENVAFGLRRRGERQVDATVMSALELVQLAHLARRKPSQLSGGQQQRIALARAVVNRPEVLLLDEPLGALDLKLRRQMQIELKRIQTEVGLTFVHVTHDQEEAMTMADTVAVMNAGRIEQLGSPADLYEHPRTTFVANFLGQSNLLVAQRVGVEGADLVLSTQAGVVRAAAQDLGDGEVLVGVRPEKIHLSAPGTAVAGGRNSIRDVTVVDASFMGVSTQYLVRTVWGQELTVFVQNLGVAQRFSPGDRADVEWEPQHTFVVRGSADAGVDPELVPATAVSGA